MVSEGSRLDAWFAGGAITATRPSFGIDALTMISADTLNLSMTGGTLVNGGISVSQTAGPGHRAASTLTVASDARVTNGAPDGAGLTVFSREAGSDVTLTSGAAIDVANIGVYLLPNGGQARFTTAAGTTIDQTGAAGSVQAGLQFTPFGNGSLLADLSGSIAATGTGLLLEPGNGDVGVTIRAGGSVTGGAAGIRVSQGAGGTGLVAIANAGTLTGGIDAALAGTAFQLSNSGTMAGSVTVTGSSVAGSQFTNSGTFTTGGSASTFAGSLTNSGMIDAADGTAGTLTIDGNLVLNAGSALRLDVGATQAATDRIIVTGSATLAGSLFAISTGSLFTPGTYTLLTANGGVTGVFATLFANPDAPIRLTYDANNVFLQFDGGAQTTLATSTRESLVFAAPIVTTNRVIAYSTQIIGRLLGGTPLYDQTFASAYNSTAVQNGVTAARVAITAAGGPGVIFGEPERISSTTTSTTVIGTATYSLAGPGVDTVSSEITFGPATVQIGALSTCNVAGLPSGTRPTCTTGGTAYVAGVDETNINTITDTVYTVTETRTDTITETLREVYELNGQIVAVGTIHGEVQSGLYDLSSRLMGRLARVQPDRAGWADGYRFRIEQGGRRDAWGLAGGVTLPLGERLTLALGAGQGWLDIAVPGASEGGEVNLTEVGAALRVDSGPFAATLAGVQGLGKAHTARTMYGSSSADYDVRSTAAGLDLGYVISLPGVIVRPVAGLDWVRVSSEAFVESDVLGLAGARQANDRVRGRAGMALETQAGPVTLGASARYLAVLSGRVRALPVAFAIAPGRSLTMRAPNEPDGLLLGAQVGVPLAKAARLTFGYDGRFGGHYTSHAVTAGFVLAW